ncbi:hypothetical protein FRC03_004217 [Tulasnella sp. 419]|nr:hypothetical protein FRC02_005001 [Tulasnella sp. 418]KAG8962472.1 hypothetical protein FRC03_004217 [Tulasnella sp. 419]
MNGFYGPPYAPPSCEPEGFWSPNRTHIVRPTPLRSKPSASGETEAEDEPVRPLPTSRIATPQNLGARSPLKSALPSVIFSLRMLAIVPAMGGTFVHLYHFYDPPPITKENQNTRVEYGLSILWALLTAHQCLSLTTGLLQRWRAYYSLLPTLIRLLALQAICWPATHLTLKLFDHSKRPLVCWTAIGTTTCVSKSIQLWVTSNLRVGTSDNALLQGPEAWRRVLYVVVKQLSNGPEIDDASKGDMKRRSRRMNWNRVLLQCVVPPAVIYFFMAWALVLKGEYYQTGC